MASPISNKVFTNRNLSGLILSNLTLRELDQVKGVGRVYNKHANEAQKRELLRCFPVELTEIVKGATFQNFHLVPPTSDFLRSAGGSPPADEVDQLSSPIVAGYDDGVAFIACKVAFSANGRIFRKAVVGMYPPSKKAGPDVVFGLQQIYGGREELMALLKTGRVVSPWQVKKDRPCCCVRLSDFIRQKICKTEIERPWSEPAVLSIENFKARRVNKVKQD